MSYSVIIPVYNNEATLRGVLDAVLSHPDITDVIAVDDASTDASPYILKSYRQVRAYTHDRNLGKGAGIAAGWKAATEGSILTVDADLTRLTAEHLQDMMDVYESGGWEMVIAARAAEYLPFSRLSGERIYRKRTVMPFIGFAQRVGNGIEQVINHAHRGKPVKTIVIPDTGHVLKYQRESPHVAAWQYLREGWQLVKTETYLRVGDFW